MIEPADTMHESMSRWIDTHYSSQQSTQHTLVLSRSSCCNLTTLSLLRADFAAHHAEDNSHERNFAYLGYDEHPCDLISTFTTYADRRPLHRSGALLFHFKDEHGQPFDVLYLSAWPSVDDISSNMVCFASVPVAYIDEWLRFERECLRIANSALPFRGQVYIIGGADTTFDATTELDDIYLPQTLKDDILKDVDAFFQKGVHIYKRLKIKPFRKLLFAGVPGTGKTMLCSALAKWAHGKGYFVVYVSGSNKYGAQFWKIHEALDMAASSEAPTVVIVEELDAYLDEDSKAQLLNVLDGSETPENPYGTLMVATTNHPEQIDDRVMKRPGRLDRIFIIPEMQSQADAEEMLRNYLGDVWRDEHRSIVPDLLGKPGAFIREVALQALTMAAYQDVDGLPLDLLRASLDTLVKQIEAKDDFLTAHKQREMGLGSGGSVFQLD